MRGAAMKVGQTLSAVDLGLVPEEIRPEFQAILAQLQQGAEPVSLQGDPGRSSRTTSASRLAAHVRATSTTSRSPRPRSARSTARRLHDGRDVAVKVQYPGIAEAIHADLQNLRLGAEAPRARSRPASTPRRSPARSASASARSSTTSSRRPTSARWRASTAATRSSSCPTSSPSCARERVIVSDYIDGARFARVLDAPQAERDRLGEILIRFYLNGPLRHRLLNGDPHPGQRALPRRRPRRLRRLRLLQAPDRRRRRASSSPRPRRPTRATPQRLLDVVVELGLAAADPALAEPFLESYRAIFGWLLADEPTDGSIACAHGGDDAPLRRAARTLTASIGLTLPAEHFVLMRAVFLLIGLLGHARGARHLAVDLAREWLFGDPARDRARPP